MSHEEKDLASLIKNLDANLSKIWVKDIGSLQRSVARLKWLVLLQIALAAIALWFLV